MKDNIEQEIEMRSTKDLIPYVRNTRTHSEEQVGQIAASIKEFGFTNPVLVDQDNMIIAGHGRVMAANKLDLKEVPTIRLDYLTEAQKRAYVIADNRLALNADWDYEMLKVELKELDDLEFDVNLLGFEDKEIDDLLAEPTEGLVDEDEVPDLPDEPVTKLGDLWQLGGHRLLCGDSTKKEDVNILMNNNRASIGITDPPYGVGYEYNKYNDISGEEYILFCEKFLKLLQQNSDFQIITGGKSNEKFYFNQSSYIEYITWFKKFGLSRGSCFRAMTTESIMLLGEKPKNKFYKTDLIECITDRIDGLRDKHTCPKPVGLFLELIERMTDKNNLVLDLFLGSGTTLIVCEKINRVCYGMELDPHYCDVIINRWEQFTGKKAELLNGKT